MPQRRHGLPPRCRPTRRARVEASRRPAAGMLRVVSIDRARSPPAGVARCRPVARARIAQRLGGSNGRSPPRTALGLEHVSDARHHTLIQQQVGDGVGPARRMRLTISTYRPDIVALAGAGEQVRTERAELLVPSVTCESSSALGTLKPTATAWRWHEDPHVPPALHAMSAVEMPAPVHAHVRTQQRSPETPSAGACRAPTVSTDRRQPVVLGHPVTAG